MSVIQKRPFIEKVIATLSSAEKSDLIGLINGSELEPSFRSLVNKSYYLSDSDEGVSHIILETSDRTYTGYLLYTDDYCVLVSYKNIQDLVILNINPDKHTFEYVKEPLTITELRFELADAGGIGSDITADEINSENATAGQVLTADGTGGASWQSVGGDLVELTNMSGTLSDSDYAKLSGDNCLLKISTQYFYKAFDASTLIIYQAFSRQAGQDQALFDYVEITKSTKGWVLTNENIVEANPDVPLGTTPTDLTGLKVGNTYLVINPATFVDWS